jgi:DNA-binding transcriptional LysR family regulator
MPCFKKGNTVRAGSRIGLSQPAVSNALRRLRHALGAELFVRQGQALVPTDFAQSLAAPLRQELDRVEALLVGPGAFDPGRAELTFRIAGSDFFAEMLMPALGSRLNEIAPRIRVQLIDLLRDSYIGTIDRYDADLSLVPDEPFPDWIARMPVFRSPFAAIARRGHPALDGVLVGGEFPIDAFCSFRHVMFSPEGNFSAMGDVALARVGRTRTVTMTLPVFYGVCRTVAESDLIALVPRQVAERFSHWLPICTYRPPMPMSTPLIVAIWHKRSNANPAHVWMRSLIADILRPLNAREEAL